MENCRSTFETGFFSTSYLRSAKVAVSGLLLCASVSRAGSPEFDFDLITLPTDLVANVVSIEDDIAISVTLPTELTLPVIPQLVVNAPIQAGTEADTVPVQDIEPTDIEPASIEPAPVIVQAPETPAVRLNTGQDLAPEVEQPDLIAKSTDQFKSTVILVASSDSDSSGAEEIAPVSPVSDVTQEPADNTDDSSLDVEPVALDAEPIEMIETASITPPVSTPLLKAESSLPVSQEPDLKPVDETAEVIKAETVASETVAPGSYNLTIIAESEGEDEGEGEGEIVAKTEDKSEVKSVVAVKSSSIFSEIDLTPSAENIDQPANTFVVASVDSTTTEPVTESTPTTIEPATLDQVVTEEQEQRINEDEIILAWAIAWSSNNVEDYLTFYDENFIPSDPALDRKSWELLRRKRLKNQNIRIIVSNAEVYRADDNLTEIRFTQRYTSSSYRDRVIKAIEMVQTPQGWKFVSERTIEKLDFK